MSPQSDWPEFGPVDANGIRSFFLITGEGLTPYRVSVHFDALRETLTRTAGDFNLYSPTEQKSLKAAAALLAARVSDEVDTEEMTPKQLAQQSLASLLKSAAEQTPHSFERYFPGLVQIVLQVASDACVKKALNTVAQACNAPMVTSEESVDLLLADLNRAIRMFLNQSGRRLETPEFLQDIEEAVRRLKKHKPKARPTQEKIAEILGTSPRALRKRMATYGIRKWDEVLIACKYWEELNSNLN